MVGAGIVAASATWPSLLLRFREASARADTGRRPSFSGIYREARIPDHRKGSALRRCPSARTYRQLDLDQRRTLFRLVEARQPVGEIAERFGRHPSTIHRELERDRFRDGDRGFCGCFPLNAQDLVRTARSRA